MTSLSSLNLRIIPAREQTTTSFVAITGGTDFPPLSVISWDYPEGIGPVSSVDIVPHYAQLVWTVNVDGTTSGVSGTTQVFANSGNPNGIVLASSPAICLDTSTTGTIWWKTDGITSASGWH